MTGFNFQEKDNCGVGVVANKFGIKDHDILLKGISALIKLSHRGAVQSDGRTGDGCGILTQIPAEYFHSLLTEDGDFQLEELFAAGNIFFSLEHISIGEQRRIIREECARIGFESIFFRLVPINVSVLGRIAKNSLPHIEQIFINAPENTDATKFEQLLYILRKNIEARMATHHDFFVCSLSSKTIIYKALCLPRILKEFYPDLADPLFKTSICVFHQRFSTNTQPSWHLAQPFRYLAHNGEINTVSANRAWAKARRLDLLPIELQEKFINVSSLVSEYGSDSFSLDNMLEMLIMSGIDYKQALRTLIPPFSEDNNRLASDVEKWYQTVGIGFEAWDGPAGVVMTNGTQVMCTLDRNGLRPLRYSITRDGTVIVASETGIIDYDNEEFITKSRLAAGEMLVIDTESKMVLFDKAVYRQFNLDLIKDNHYETIKHDLNHTLSPLSEKIDTYKKLFHVSYEEMEQVMRVMALDGVEPTMSMGDDAAIAVLSSAIRPLTDYFRQSFAQVTNPAIDSLREKYVMSLNTHIGIKPNLVTREELAGYKLDSPVLDSFQFNQILSTKNNWQRNLEINLSYSKSGSLKESLIILANKCVSEVASGINVVILNDENISKEELIIPAALAIGAIHNRLVDAGLRHQVDLVVATATARDSHHFCVLLGYGATAIYPYLSYQLIAELHTSIKSQEPLAKLINNYLATINKGILKIMSKMGIATVASYRGSQLFEALGISSEICDICFNQTSSRIEGLNFANLEEELSITHKKAWDNSEYLAMGGILKYSFFGEYHGFNPDVVAKLQKAVNTGNLNDFYDYSNQVNQRKPMCIRDLFKLNLTYSLGDLSEDDLLNPRMDSIDELCRRFDSAAMSIGALSKEAHEALALAMNTIGGRSNSGEGGEDPLRYGSMTNSKIKQVASGRFGVTPSYLMSAEIIQIKISQGAKPGEGGQLPGEKVSVEIAKLRHATPGVTLISPPPHHDIYSIEDLAQLIFDLKQLNPGAMISVKLVSEPGIGVIACGVAKAQADLITISGYDGGTGAAPVVSVKHAGSPWELGIAETHAALVANNLRHKIRLQVDGGLKTGLDVVKAAILGAETFGFGTAPMIALGCKYLRICHLNNCATGLATQNEKLRQEHFNGIPEMVINFFRGIAHEVRQIMHYLGVNQLTDLIGRTDLLSILENPNGKKLDLKPILELAAINSNYPRYYSEANIGHDRGVLNQRIYADCMEAVYNLEPLNKNYGIYNTDRSAGATLAGEIAKNYGNHGLDNPIRLNFKGIAGQSFGVFACRGMELYLEGEANDYVGKGLAGGKLVIKHQNPNITSAVTVMGNTCLYGATSGFLFANGNAGDRFAARNSGVVAVIEGLASNGCEYMTGGVVSILGSIDQNFGAGMTGGLCYIWDNLDKVRENLNPDFIEADYLKNITENKDEHYAYLKELIEKHYQETRSSRAMQFLADIDSNINEIVLIKPKAIKAADLTRFLTR
jgi:glutamate synthase (NADPH/NADH) large chain